MCREERTECRYQVGDLPEFSGGGLAVCDLRFERVGGLHNRFSRLLASLLIGLRQLLAFVDLLLDLIGRARDRPGSRCGFAVVDATHAGAIWERESRAVGATETLEAGREFVPLAAPLRDRRAVHRDADHGGLLEERLDLGSGGIVGLEPIPQFSGVVL